MTGLSTGKPAILQWETVSPSKTYQNWWGTESRLEIVLDQDQKAIHDFFIAVLNLAFD